MMSEITTTSDTTESVCFQKLFIFIMANGKQYLELILHQSINQSINQSVYQSLNTILLIVNH